MKERIRGKWLLLTWPVAGLVLLLAKCSERFAEYAFVGAQVMYVHRG